MPLRSIEPQLEEPGREAHERVREALVARARQRVRAGFYDRADVTRALIEALYADLALS
jgi:hypothetical protein